MAAPTTELLFLQEIIEKPVLTLLLKVRPKFLASILKTYPPALCLAFVTSERRLSFLGNAWNKKVSARCMAQVQLDLTSFDVYIDNPPSADEFVALLVGFEVAELAGLLAACPPYGVPAPAKMSVLSTALKDCSASDLIRCFKLCNLAQWGADESLLQRITLLQSVTVLYLSLPPAIGAKPAPDLIDAHQADMLKDQTVLGMSQPSSCSPPLSRRPRRPSTRCAPSATTQGVCTSRRPPPQVLTRNAADVAARENRRLRRPRPPTGPRQWRRRKRRQRRF